MEVLQKKAEVQTSGMLLCKVKKTNISDLSFLVLR